MNGSGWSGGAAVEISPAGAALDSPIPLLSDGIIQNVFLGENVALRAGGNAFTGNQTISSGYLGIGTMTPQAQLEISSGGLNSLPQARLNQTSFGDYSRLRFTVGGDYSKRWDLACRSNIFVLYSGQFDANMLQLVSTGLTVRGTVVSSSDRNAKENFKPVNPLGVLEKVATLPLSQWNYKADAATPHIGPMAQDFHAAFGVGPDEKHIATVDADGVALAAIQGLNQKLEETRAELKRRDAENA